MPLSPEEQKRLDELEQKSMSAEEESRLAELESKAAQFEVPDRDAMTDEPIPEQRVTPGLLAASARGAGQGATFGTSDEILGFLGSVLSGQDREQLTEDIRKANKDASELEPVAYTGGEILGSLAVPLPGLNKITKPIGALASKVGPLTKATAEMSAGGAIASGASAFGHSDNPDLPMRISESLDAAQDGAWQAPAIGLGVQGLMATPGLIKKLGNEFMTRTNRDIPYVFKRGKEVPGYMSPANVKKTNAELITHTEDELVPLINQELQEAAVKKFGDDLAKAEGRVNVDDVRKGANEAFETDLPSVANNPEYQKAQARVNEVVDSVSGKRKVTEKVIDSGDAKAVLKSQETMAKDMKKLESEAMDMATAEADEIFSKIPAGQYDPTELAQARQEIIQKSFQEKMNKVMPTITEETEQVSKVPMQVLRYTTPSGKTVTKPEIIRPMLDLHAIDVVDNVNLSAKDLNRIRMEARDLAEQSRTTSTKAGNPDIFKAAKRLEDMAERRMQEVGADINAMKANYRTQKEAQEILGIEGEVDKVKAGSQVARKMKDAAANPERENAINIDRTRQKIKDTGLLSADKVDATFDKGQQLAKDAYILNNARQESPLINPGFVKGTAMPWLVSTYRSGTNTMAANAGEATRVISEKMEPVRKAVDVTRKVGQKLYQKSPEQIKSIADTVSNMSLKNLLNKIADTPEAKRKALVWTLMQQPAYREMLKPYDEGTEDDGEQAQ